MNNESELNYLISILIGTIMNYHQFLPARILLTFRLERPKSQSAVTSNKENSALTPKISLFFTSNCRILNFLPKMIANFLCKIVEINVHTNIKKGDQNAGKPSHAYYIYMFQNQRQIPNFESVTFVIFFQSNIQRIVYVGLRQTKKQLIRQKEMIKKTKKDHEVTIREDLRTRGLVRACSKQKIRSCNADSYQCTTRLEVTSACFRWCTLRLTRPILLTLAMPKRLLQNGQSVDWIDHGLDYLEGDA